MYIKVHVKTGGRVETFEKINTDYFFICVKERAERNIANRRVVELVARHFRIYVGKVRIIIGHRSPSKILSVDTETKI